MKTCPVCERPAGDDERNEATCRMWYFVERGYVADGRAFVDCYRRGKDRRAEVAFLKAELLDVREQLRVAKKALARHHEKANRKDEPFRRNARIE